jgi:hypothetical protein
MRKPRDLTSHGVRVLVSQISDFRTATERVRGQLLILETWLWLFGPMILASPQTEVDFLPSVGNDTN